MDGYKPKTINQLDVLQGNLSDVNIFVMRQGETIAKRLPFSALLASITPRNVDLIVGTDIEGGIIVHLIPTAHVQASGINLSQCTITGIVYNNMPLQNIAHSREDGSLNFTSINGISEGVLTITFIPVSV